MMERLRYLSGGPGAGDGGGFGVSRPGGHGGYEDRQGLGAGVAELESGADGDVEADAGLQVQDLLIVGLFTPDLTLALQHVPDFLNGAVDDRG